MSWCFGNPGTNNFMLLNFRVMGEFQIQKILSTNRVPSSGPYNFEPRYLRWPEKRFGKLKAPSFILHQLNQRDTMFAVYINTKTVNLTDLHSCSLHTVFVSEIISLFFLPEIRVLVLRGKTHFLTCWIIR
jgi:hypothetical protein